MGGFGAFTILLVLVSMMQYQTAQAQLINLALQSSFPYTRNDGVTPDKSVSYISLNGTSGMSIPLDNIKLNTKTSFTAMIWFKSLDPNFGNSYQYILAFDNSLQVYLTGTQSIMSESDNTNSRLTVSTSSIGLNQWVHLSVAGSVTNSQSYITLEQTGKGVISQASGPYQNFMQVYTPFRVCVGGCPSSSYSFIGGFREFKLFTTYLNSTQTSLLKHQYMFWDSQMLAYYRFFSNDVLGNELQAYTAQITSGQYSSVKDYSAINDVCQPITNYISLYQFQTNSDFQNLPLDARYDPPLLGWGYTFSMWINLNKATCTQSNPSTATTSCNLVLLQDAFMIFMPATNQIAAYFFNNKGYYQYQTPSITVPYNQWFNLQFIVGEYQGYELRVYDILGRQMASQLEVRDLQQNQVMNKNYKMFIGFSGFVKNLVLYTDRKSLPTSPPSLDLTLVDPYVIMNDCLVYFEFQTQFIFSPKNGTNKLKNLCRHYSYGTLHETLSIGVNAQSTGIYWKQYTVSGSQDGLVSSGTQLFDGVACEDGDTILQTTASQSYIAANTYNYITSTQPNVTVEFWFKTSIPVVSTNYLFSLYGQVKSKEYFSIFYDSTTNRKLLCAPFGYLSTTSPIVAFNGFTDDNRLTSGWFHIACQYETQKNVIGYLYNSNNLEEMQTTSLSSSNLVFQPDTYTVYVGNSALNTQATVGSIFKEVRFWLTKRAFADIKYWRFRQLNPKSYSPDVLEIYLRLNEGSYKEFNAASIINTTISYPSVQFQNVSYISDSLLTICPMNTFKSDSDGNCYLDPVQYVDGAIYPDYQSSTSTLYWVFSANESVMMDSSVVNQVRTSWIFGDAYTQALISKNATYKSNTINLRVPSPVFKDESTYMVTLNFSNTDLTYLEYKSFNFVPRSCQYYIMSGSDAMNNYLNYSFQQSKYDITFNLTQVQLKTYCSEISFYNQLVQYVGYRFSPPLTYTPQLNFTFNADQSITVVIPAKEQAKFPMLYNISIIFTIKYDNSFYLQQGLSTSNTLTFQNVKQVIYFNKIGQTLSTAILPNATQIFKSQSLQIQAFTNITNSDGTDYSRLTYSWTCPIFLTNVCPTGNQSTIVISSSWFIPYGGVYGTLYNFTVFINYTDMFGVNSNSSLTTSVTWYNITSSDFTIVPPSKVLSTAASQQFSLTFVSYASSSQLPSTMNIQWYVIPSMTSLSLYSFSGSQSVLTVKAGAFATSTTYNITVVANNTIGTASAVSKQTYIFTTSTPPTGGSVTINPSIGYVNQTNLTVSITNWQSNNQPVVFMVWSTNTSSGTTANQALSGWIPSSQTFKFIPTDTNPYLIQITDNSGEQVWVKNTPAITIQPATQITNTTSTSTNSTSNSTTTLIQMQQALQVILDNNDQSTVQTKYDQLTTYASSQLNSSTGNSQTALQAKTQTKLAIINQIENDTQSLQDEQASEADSSVISKGALQVIPIILYDDSTLTSEVVQKSLDVINTILSQDQTTVQALLRDSTFLANFAQSIAGFMQFDKDQQSTSRRYRNLRNLGAQSSISTQVRQLRQILESQMCNDTIENQSPSQMETTGFDLVVQKFTLDTSIQNQTYRYVDDSSSAVSFDIYQIAQSLVPQSTSVLDTFCVVTTFMKIQPILNQSSLYQQYSTQSLEYYIQSTRTNQVYPSAVYTPQDNVEATFQLNPSTFYNNQTICMVYYNTTQLWDGGQSCVTTIDTQLAVANCSCTLNSASAQYQYGLVNDFSRIQGPQLTFTNPSKSISNNVNTNTNTNTVSDSSVQIDTSYSFLIVTGILLVIMCGLPVAAIIFDRKDYRTATTKELDKSAAKILDSLSKQNNKPFKYWQLRQTEVQEHTLGLKSNFSLVLQEIHPLINILTKYSVEQPRIIRFSTLLLQISAFTLVITMVFGPNYRQGQEDRIENGLDQKDISNIVIFGIIGAIILTPATFITKLFERKIKVQKQSGNFSSESQREQDSSLPPNMNSKFDQNYNSNEANSHQISPPKVLYTNQRILSKSMSQTTENNRPSLSLVRDRTQVSLDHKDELIMRQQCKPLFVIVITLAYFIAFAAIALSFIYASQMPISNQYCLIASFYIGVIGSMVFSNMVRVGINSMLVQKYSTTQPGFGKKVLKLLIARETLEMYELGKIIKDIQSESKDGHQNQTQQQLIRHNQNKTKNLDSTQKQFNGGLYNLSRGVSIDNSNVQNLQKQSTEELDNVLQEDDDFIQTKQLSKQEIIIQNEDSLYIDQMNQIDEDSYQQKPLSPDNRHHQRSQIIKTIPSVDYDLNSSVDARADSQDAEFFNAPFHLKANFGVKSVGPFTSHSSVGKGLFSSSLKKESTKKSNQQKQHKNPVSTVFNTEISNKTVKLNQSPEWQRQSLTAQSPIGTDKEKYSQVQTYTNDEEHVQASDRIDM